MEARCMMCNHMAHGYSRAIGHALFKASCSRLTKQAPELLELVGP